jgi:ligand-binding SRPBCC domain-containing protein
MSLIVTRGFVRAAPEVVFDLSRSIEVHLESTRRTRERAVGGVTSGLLGPGDGVTWSAVHLGLRWRLSSRISAFDRPRHLQDEQVRGPFAWFRHDHWFEAVDGGTAVLEHFEYAAPLGPLGRLVERLVLDRHMTRFLEERFATIQRVAEGG